MAPNQMTFYLIISRLTDPTALYANMSYLGIINSATCCHMHGIFKTSSPHLMFRGHPFNIRLYLSDYMSLRVPLRHNTIFVILIMLWLLSVIHIINSASLL